jgi:hypothetical protein
MELQLPQLSRGASWVAAVSATHAIFDRGER